MSLAREIVERSVDALRSELALDEIQAEQGVYEVLRSDVMPDFSGTLRVFRGTKHIERMISTSLVMPSRGHQTHMVFCFGAPDTLIPHFTIDTSDHGEGRHAFHLDLIPRLELGAHLAYMREVYGPLTPAFDRAKQIEGLGSVPLTPEQHAVMSPWMLVHTATRDAFTRVEQEIMMPYRERFLALARHPPSGPEPRPERDRAARSALFDPTVDPVWGRVQRVLGIEVTDLIRRLLDGTREP